jgi:hypothetical protein
MTDKNKLQHWKEWAMIIVACLAAAFVILRVLWQAATADFPSWVVMSLKIIGLTCAVYWWPYVIVCKIKRRKIFSSAISYYLVYPAVLTTIYLAYKLFCH